MLRHHAKGRRMTGPDRCPYGWRPDPPDTERLIDDADEQATIARIRADRQHGRGLREIARRLDVAGIACRGGRWSHTTVRSVSAVGRARLTFAFTRANGLTRQLRSDLFRCAITSSSWPTTGRSRITSPASTRTMTTKPVGGRRDVAGRGRPIPRARRQRSAGACAGQGPRRKNFL